MAGKEKTVFICSERVPSTVQATQVPLTCVGRPDSSICEGFSTSHSPRSRISNTPTSFVEP